VSLEDCDGVVAKTREQVVELTLIGVIFAEFKDHDIASGAGLGQP
jgi:hypothetical protein